MVPTGVPLVAIAAVLVAVASAITFESVETTPTSSVGGEAHAVTISDGSSGISSKTDQPDNDWGCVVAIAHTGEKEEQRVVFDTATNCDKTPVSFGKVTSKSGECVVGEPTSYIKPAYIDWIWENRLGPNANTSNEANWNILADKNWIMDHLVANNGSLNYCVRWDSKTEKLPKTTAAKVQDMLTRHYNAWNKWLVGYNCWPFEKIAINVVGFAARDASQFEWSDDSLGTLYEGDYDSDGIPHCPLECFRFNDNDTWSDTSACQGKPYDMYLHLNDNIGYGFGSSWGQEVSLSNTLGNIDMEHILLVGHEIGHGFGLPDFYVDADKPANDFPNTLMMAFSSITITPSDGWMLRRVLEELKPRYDF